MPLRRLLLSSFGLSPLLAVALFLLRPRVFHDDFCSRLAVVPRAAVVVPLEFLLAGSSHTLSKLSPSVLPLIALHAVSAYLPYSAPLVLAAPLRRALHFLSLLVSTVCLPAHRICCSSGSSPMADAMEHLLASLQAMALLHDI